MLLGAAAEREAMANSLRELATEQASLRRVAVLVAHGAPRADVVAAVATETASLLDADATRLLRDETPGAVTVIAEYSKPVTESLLGRRLAVEGGVTELVLQPPARPARTAMTTAAGPSPTWPARKGSIRRSARRSWSRAGVWGAVVVLWARPEPPPPVPRSGWHSLPSS